jgi:hypothetical protein
VRLRISAVLTPCGSRLRSAAHSASVRRQGSAGQLSRIASTTVRRCTAERSVRAAASSATRRTRSETCTPSGAAAAQPSRRSAIQPLVGSARPSRPMPDSSVARSPSFQRATTTVVASFWVSAGRNPTRSASSRAGTSSPPPPPGRRCRSPWRSAQPPDIPSLAWDTRGGCRVRPDSRTWGRQPRRPENHSPPSSAQRCNVNRCIPIGLPSPIATTRCISPRTSTTAYGGSGHQRIPCTPRMRAMCTRSRRAGLPARAGCQPGTAG